jgi:iron complex transport system ATP-binding protein
MIEARNISQRFGDVHALRGIRASAPRGAIVAVVGPNAAGKSTLLRCLAGAIAPSEGLALLQGSPVRKLAAATRARRLAFVPQRPTIAADFSVHDVVELGRYALEASPRRVDEALAACGLRDLAGRPYRQLSAGQQQRVVIARALAQVDSDGALILDEPLTAMDVRHQLELVALLRAQAAAGGCVLMSVHDLGLAAAVADEVWLLHQGALVASGPAREVLSEARLAQVFEARFSWRSDMDGRPRLLLEGPLGGSARMMP